MTTSLTLWVVSKMEKEYNNLTYAFIHDSTGHAFKLVEFLDAI